jgi:5-amino-6-(5-phospho-D-ribitylamino)uracil phosphatase
MNQLYKLVAFDIDGVLNEHGGNIMDESIEAIGLLKSRAIQVCFASGKHAWYVQGGLVWSGLLDPNTLIVAENGGVIFEPSTRRTIMEEKYIRDVGTLRNVYRNLLSRDGGFLKFAGITVWEEPKETLFCLFPKDLKHLSRLKAILSEIVQINNLSLTVVQNPDSIDVLQSGISKATGLTYICDWLGIEMTNIIAFGDNINDLEMLNSVGLPITVDNAVEETKTLVKKRGGYIAKQVCGKGVLEAVKHLIAEQQI